MSATSWITSPPGKTDAGTQHVFGQVVSKGEGERLPGDPEGSVHTLWMTTPHLPKC